MAKTSTAVASTKNNLPANLNQTFAEELANLQKRIAAPSGDKIKCLKSKHFQLPNGDTLEELEAIVIDFVAANFYYQTAYKEDNPMPPNCFALGLEPVGLCPSDNSPDKQCESCAACWANKFDTHPNGRGGKACQNTRLLAILPPDADIESPIMVLKISATAVKSFDAHVATVARSLNTPVRAVITRITFDQSSEYQSPRFAVDRVATKDQILMAQNRLEEARTRLLTEPDVSQHDAANDSKPVQKRTLGKKAPPRRAA